MSLQCGHCFSTTGYPGRFHQHGYGGAGGEQRDVAMRRDRHPEAEGHVASRSWRHHHPGELARRYVLLDLAEKSYRLFHLLSRKLLHFGLFCYHVGIGDIDFSLSFVIWGYAFLYFIRDS